MPQMVCTHRKVFSETYRQTSPHSALPVTLYTIHTHCAWCTGDLYSVSAKILATHRTGVFKDQKVRDEMKLEIVHTFRFLHALIGYNCYRS